MRLRIHLSLMTTFCCIALLLSACEKQWGLSIVGANNMGPIFCISSRGKCDEKGTEMDSIYISELNKDGNNEKYVWETQNRSNNPKDHVLKSLEYGKVPEGWKETIPAQPIKDNVYYSVNGEFFFFRDRIGKYTIITRKDFFDMLYSLRSR